MSRTTTNVLVALLLVAAVASVAAGLRLSNQRAAALRAREDLAAVEADLADLAAWNVTEAAGASADASSLNRRIRAAAAGAGLVEQLVSVEPGSGVRVGESGVLRTPIFLRLEGVTLERLVPFLNDLTQSDAALRVTGIDLSAPPVPAAGEIETWTADLTLSESTVAADASTP